MKARSPSRSARFIVVCTARIASFVAAGDQPPDRAWFLLAAALTDAARRGDAEALEIGLASSAALLEGLPVGEGWELCRGQLRTTLHFAWLMRKAEGPGELFFTHCQKGKEDASDG